MIEYAEMAHWRSPLLTSHCFWIVGRAMVMALRFERSRNIAEHLAGRRVGNTVLETWIEITYTTTRIM